MWYLSCQCVIFYIKTLPCTYVFVQPLQGGTECPIQMGQYAVYVPVFDSFMTKTRACTVNTV